MSTSSEGRKFSRDSTTSDVLQGVQLKGKLAVVTGGSVGLGKETARALGSAGADILLGARSAESLEQAQSDLHAAGIANVWIHTLDLMDKSSVETFASYAGSLGRPIDILIANAGIMACPLRRDARGNEAQLSTNYLGHALLVSQLAPMLTAADRARFVALSSTAHHMSPVILNDLNFTGRPYEKWAAYGQSKTASSLLAVKVSDALRPKGVTAVAVHPGMIATDLLQYLTPEDLERQRAAIGDGARDMPAFKSVEAGAATSVWAATALELEGSGFAYLEDCGIAPVIDAPNYAFGVLPYATDRHAADQLWGAAEELLKTTLPL